MLGPVLAIGLDRKNFSHLSNPDLQAMPYLAVCHVANAVKASALSNEQGMHSVAVCLVRQCVEAITIFEIGLQDRSFTEPLLMAWKEGSKSQGELRRSLENHVWTSYGTGLWEELWAEFFGNLARSVQPYAHYTPELQGWQFATVNYSGGHEFTVMVGPGTYDALQASRVTLLHCLVGWAMARVLLASKRNSGIRQWSVEIDELGRALAKSKLLFHRADWGAQLAPHMLFLPGHDWTDE